jgi:predicted RNase H-like HicB family nuclease
MRLEQMMTNTQTYEVILEPSDEGGFTAYVPALRGCVSEGDTEDEALLNIREAILLWHEAWQDVTREDGSLVRTVEVAR